VRRRTSRRGCYGQIVFAEHHFGEMMGRLTLITVTRYILRGRRLLMLPASKSNAMRVMWVVTMPMRVDRGVTQLSGYVWGIDAKSHESECQGAQRRGVRVHDHRGAVREMDGKHVEGQSNPLINSSRRRSARQRRNQRRPTARSSASLSSVSCAYSMRACSTSMRASRHARWLTSSVSVRSDADILLTSQRPSGGIAHVGNATPSTLKRPECTINRPPNAGCGRPGGAQPSVHGDCGPWSFSTSLPRLNTRWNAAMIAGCGMCTGGNAW
jgi:hypothetical protein